MSMRVVVTPVWRIECEAAGCTEFFIDGGWVGSSIRHNAAREGWSVRPNKGKGSRTAPDLCPEHAPGAGAS